ncbi:MAG: transglycosylase SLT domain-containing protein [Porphyromonadaceae bacterium]|jgi:membrane-bound lytic murein transglycosylase D|nr:transglycosylase SLT domain-containing protein [Porphyromonadaceae bacterium]
MTKRIFLVLILISCLTVAYVYPQLPRLISVAEKNDEKPTYSEPAYTQVDDREIDDEEIRVVTVIPEDFTSSLDYLLHNWAIDKNSTTNCKPKPNPSTTDKQYKERLRKLPHEIEMPFNSAVKSFIEIYTQKSRRQVENLYGLSSYYMPIFEEALEAQQIPLELKYLPIIESALNPRAVSRAGATGIWQFMIATGRMYGLEVNSLVDERMDPYKSSQAAARYLKDLYNIFSDWHLAIAAYNCGPGNVNKAIRRAGGKQDFWAIYPYLPAETRSYLPIFIAANYVMNYFDEHNLCPAQLKIPVLTDTIMVNKRIHLEQIAAVLRIPLEEVRILNPQYRKDIVPGETKPYPICLPHNYANLFIDKNEEILAYKADILINNRRYETEIPLLASARKSSGSSAKYTYHTVRKGQSISVIARRYGISQAQLRRANSLKSTKIKAGQRLKIPR